MAWEKVKIAVWGDKYDGQKNGNRISLQNNGEPPTQLSVGKSAFNVVECQLDERDNVYKLIVAEATHKEKKSDGKSTKRTD